MKKAIIIFTVFALIFAFSGCGKNQASITINTVPENASVSIDGTYVKNPVKDKAISEGKHEITVSAPGYETVKKEISIDAPGVVSFKITLEKVPATHEVLIKTKGKYMIVIDKHCLRKFTGEPIRVKDGIHEIQLINYFDAKNKPYSLIGKFDITKDVTLSDKDFKNETPQYPDGQLFSSIDFISPVPVIRCCSAAAITYSGIYTDETIDLKGFTPRNIKSFYIVFPSGKRVEIRTKAGNCDCCANYFEKKVTFNETGKYEIKNEGSSNGSIGEYFNVFYKAKPVSHVTTVKELFPFLKDYTKDAIVVIEGEEETVKLLITDANGEITRNMPIGKYGLTTDKNGIVTFSLTGRFGSKNSLFGCCGELFVNGKDAPPLIYGDLLANLVRKVSISKKYAKKINGDFYVPEKMISPCLSRPPKKTITVDGEKYVNITEMINHPELFPGNTVKEDKNTFVVYGLVDMVP